jgi:hypothetical protein
MTSCNRSLLHVCGVNFVSCQGQGAWSPERVSSALLCFPCRYAFVRIVRLIDQRESNYLPRSNTQTAVAVSRCLEQQDKPYLQKNSIPRIENRSMHGAESAIWGLCCSLYTRCMLHYLINSVGPHTEAVPWSPNTPFAECIWMYLYRLQIHWKKKCSGCVWCGWSVANSRSPRHGIMIWLFFDPEHGGSITSETS